MIKKFNIGDANNNKNAKNLYASSSPDYGRIQRAASVLPEGAVVSEGSFGSKKGNMSTLSNYGMGYGQIQQQYGDGMFHVNRFYDPEVESPDRQYFPRDRIRANKYWRLFYEQDALIGNAIDMYANMMISDFDVIIQNDNNTQIRNNIADMLENIQFVQKFKDLIVEYLIIGEAFPHLFFDDTSGLWSYLTLHNADNMEVVDAPVVNMEPIINYVPDQFTIQLLNDSSNEAREIRDSLPPEFLAKVRAGQKIRMKNINCSYIPRKLHPYYERGTSILSRLWRILLCEDSVYNATIAMFRRHACFVAGTGVLTSEGVKNIEDVKVGDTVVSGEGNYRKVLAAWEEPPSPTVTIKALGTEPLVCTPNHNFKVWVRPRTCACGCGESLDSRNSRNKTASFIYGHNCSRGDKARASWKTYSERPLVRCFEDHDPIQKIKAEDIRPGDYMLIPRKFEQVDIEVNEKTKAMARLLGYYAAEGSRIIHYRKKDGKITSEERDWFGVNLGLAIEEMSTHVKDILEICESLEVEANFSVKLINTGNRVGICEIDINRKDYFWLTKWLVDNSGEYSNRKKLSEEVMGWPLELKVELLRGLFGGDAHKSKTRKCVEFGITSKSLSYQVKLIFAQLGYFGHTTIKKYSPHLGWSDNYRLCFYGDKGNEVRSLMWGDPGPTTEKESAIRYWVDDDYVYVPVQKVSINKVLVPVFNLTVEGDSSYIAQGVQSFNSPLKVLKMGNANSGWIPSVDEWQNLLSLVVSAEQDPQAWIATHYGVQFEAWGANERSVTISKENDVIEKIKLTGLGLSKSFISGDGTFASSKSGLQVFLRRLLSLRQYFEAVWIYPKLINPICEINGWTKNSPSSSSNGFRVKRGQESVDSSLNIKPRIRWKNKLDPMVDSDMLQAYQQLRNLGFPVSNDTIGTSVYLKWDNELEKQAKEFKEKDEVLLNVLGERGKNLFKQDQEKKSPSAKPTGAPGSGALPTGAKPPAKPMDDASKPPGSGPDSMPNVPMGDGVEAPSGGGVPEGV